MPSEAGEVSQQIGAPVIAGIDRHHSREYHQTYKNPSARGKNAIEVRTLGNLLAHHSLEPLPPQL
jgi:hypothetical protein